MTNTKRPRKAAVLRLLGARITELRTGLPPDDMPLHPMIRDQVKHIQGQIAALEDVKGIVSGERKGFSE